MVTRRREKRLSASHLSLVSSRRPDSGTLHLRLGRGQARPQELALAPDSWARLMVGQGPLLDLLTEFLAVERGTVQVYQVVLARCPVETLKPRLREFLDQTSRQRDCLIHIIRLLGGSEELSCTAARLARLRVERLLELAMGVSTDSLRELWLTDLQTLILLETLRRDNWAYLLELGPKLGNETVTGLLAGRAGDSLIEEELHLEWASAELNAARSRALGLPFTHPR